MEIRLEKSDFNLFAAGYAEQVAHGFRPRSDTKPIRLTPPLDWDMDPLKDRNWRFQLHAWRMLPPIWQEHYGRDWLRLKQEVLPWVRDWYFYHVAQGRTSAFMWYDMATGLRAQHLALLIHLVQQGDLSLTAGEQAEVDELAIMHVAMLRDPSFISEGNHGIFQLVGLRLLGIVLEGRPELRGEEPHTSRQMRTLIEAQFGPQGVHVENSPDYHNFAVKHFSKIRPELFPSIADVFEKKLRSAREIAPWFTMPNGSIAAIGDSSGNGARFTRACAPDAESVTRWGDRILMKDLSAGGYAMVRTGAATPRHRAEMLLVKGQASSYGHAHADHLGFELFVQGRPLFVDSGKYSYNNGEWRDYFISDRAHNVVGLRDRVFGPGDTVLGRSGLTGVKSSGSQYVINGRVSRRKGFTHRRRFKYRPGEWLVLEDAIAAPAGARPVVYLHLAEHADAEITQVGTIEVTVHGRRVATVTYPTSEFSTAVVRGQEEPVLQGWVSPGYGVKRPSTVIEFTGGDGLRSWEIEIGLHEPTRPSGLLQRALPGDISVPFLYSCRADRLLPLPGNETERRVLLEYYSGDPASIENLLAEELVKGGFARTRIRPEQGGVRAYYRSKGGVRINMLVRPAGTFGVRTVGAVGSVSMTVTTAKR